MYFKFNLATGFNIHDCITNLKNTVDIHFKQPDLNNDDVIQNLTCLEIYLNFNLAAGFNNNHAIENHS